MESARFELEMEYLNSIIAVPFRGQVWIFDGFYDRRLDYVMDEEGDRLRQSNDKVSVIPEDHYMSREVLVQRGLLYAVCNHAFHPGRKLYIFDGRNYALY